MKLLLPSIALLGAGANAFLSAQACAPVAVLFSRGTFEQGEFGFVGGPLVAAIQNILPPGQIYWGNEYDNSVFGYLSGGSSTGTESMRKKAEELVSRCPGIKLVWSGYSQGAQVTHKALAACSSACKSATKAVVLFGDPKRGEAISGISSSIINTDCDSGDQICNGLPLISAAHVGYGKDADRLAAWVKGKLGPV